MDKKIIVLSLIAAAVVLFFGYSFLNSSRTTDVAVEQVELLGGADKLEIVNGTIVGITEDEFTVRTSEGIFNIEKLPGTRYEVVSDQISSNIVAGDVGYNEQAIIIVATNTSTNEMRAMSVVIYR